MLHAKTRRREEGIAQTLLPRIITPMFEALTRAPKPSAAGIETPLLLRVSASPREQKPTLRAIVPSRDTIIQRVAA